jgi:hypothetical protein
MSAYSLASLWRCLLLVVLLAVLLAACQSMPAQHASAQERVAAAQVALGATYSTLTDLYLAGKIKREEAIAHRDKLTSVHIALDAAEGFARAAKPAAADERLAAANASLEAVKRALQAQSAGGKP